MTERTNPAATWHTVLFDFDGTIVDTIPLIVASLHHTRAVSGLPPETEEQARSWIGRPLSTIFTERYPDRADELMQTYRAWSNDHHDELIREVPGMPELLRDLTAAGIRTGVVSSKPSPGIHRGLQAVGLDGLIELLVSQEDTDRHKPDPEPLRLAASMVGEEPGDCVYVGDASVDIAAARATGMASIGVTWGAAGESLADHDPDVLVHDVAELRRALIGR